MVDAVTGAVLHRQNQVESSNDVFPFRAGHRHRVRPQAPVRAHRRQDPHDHRDRGRWRTPPTTSSSRSSTPAGTLLDQQRPGHQPRGRDVHRGRRSRPASTRCRSARSTTRPSRSLPPGNYAASVTTSDTGTAAGAGAAANPRWRYFTANPTLDSPPDHADQLRHRLLAPPAPAARRPPGRSATSQAFGPWDTDVNRRADASPRSATTRAPTRPGSTRSRPAAPRRRRSRRRATTPTGSPTPGTTPAATRPASRRAATTSSPSVTNLFVAHNRMHDYAYYLGFTEDNYNLQADNLAGRGAARRATRRSATRRPAR